MSQITLKAGETKVLVAAAANGGRITSPAHLKQTTREHMAGIFGKQQLAEALGDELHLTRAGYRAVGLRPPRKPAAARGAAQVSKQDVVRDLLVREGGATLSELIDATGWLPHTTRAALSRLRSGGQELAKAKRHDGVTCYRLLPPAGPTKVARRKRDEAAAEIAA